MGSRRFPREAWLAPLLLAGLTFAVHRVALSASWSYDDPILLRHASEHSPWEIFAVPEAWRALSPLFLMPWLSLSYAADLLLFGLSPGGFFAHHLVALAALGTATYFLLRLWVTPPWALFGAALPLLSAPAAGVARQLQARHYVEGLLFAALALRAFVLAVRRDRGRDSARAALLYGLALSAKEVFLPLVGVLLVLPEGRVRDRLRHLVLPLLVAAGYLPWRAWMLGDLVGGHAGGLDPAAIASLPRLVFAQVLGEGLPALTVAVLALAVVAAALRRTPRALPALAVTVLAVAAPLLPAAPWVADSGRLLLLPSWVLGLALALALGRAVQGAGPRAVTAFVLALALFHQGGNARDRFAEIHAAFEGKGRFLLTATADQVLLAEDGTWFELGLPWVREHLGDGRRSTVLFDLSQAQDLDPAAKTVWRYEPTLHAVRDVTAELPALLAEWRARVDERPFSVRMHHADGWVHWSLGHYEGARYTLLDPVLFGRVNLAAAGSNRWHLVEPLVFRIRCDGPEGWITYSPWLTFGGRPGDSAVWTR